LLHIIDKTDGTAPEGALIQLSDGNFYGTTYGGGAYGKGTIFKITPGGTLTMLYSFCAQSGCSDGSNPIAGLVQASNGKLYGTTYGGGAYNDGTVFSLSSGPWGGNTDYIRTVGASSTSSGPVSPVRATSGFDGIGYFRRVLEF
jgi:uncharacterized repeat protein (TIGR03803 family)